MEVQVHLDEPMSSSVFLTSVDEELLTKVCMAFQNRCVNEDIPFQHGCWPHENRMDESLLQGTSTYSVNS